MVKVAWPPPKAVNEGSRGPDNVKKSIQADYIHRGRKVIDFHWSGKSSQDFPETFREVALEQGLPVGKLRKISY